MLAQGRSHVGDSPGAVLAGSYRHARPAVWHRLRRQSRLNLIFARVSLNTFIPRRQSYASPALESLEVSRSAGGHGPCGLRRGDGDAPEETRAQDGRSFAPANPSATSFDALAAASGDVVDNASTSRWAGVLEGAAYRIEVPANWNGRLVMYAHGYAGEGSALNVTNPSIRRYLIQNGYAWARPATARTTTTCAPAWRTRMRWRWPSTAWPHPTAGRWRSRSACTSPAIPWA